MRLDRSWCWKQDLQFIQQIERQLNLIEVAGKMAGIEIQQWREGEVELKQRQEIDQILQKVISQIMLDSS